jgi:hypothetical protein
MLEDRDLAEFRGTILTGMTVGIGSLILLFSNGTQILLQCTFECNKGGVLQSGHGEDINTSPLLFNYMNCRVNAIMVDDNLVLTLQFDTGGNIRIIPERNGLESYVVTTLHGICPVIT